MLEICPVCQAEALFTTELCPHCGLSSAAHERQPVTSVPEPSGHAAPVQTNVAGKVLIGFIVGLPVAGEFLRLGCFRSDASDVFRVIGLCVLAACLCRGAVWAKWLWVVLAVLGGIVSLAVAALAGSRVGGPLQLGLAALGVCYLLSAACLMCSSAANAFLRDSGVSHSRKGRR